MDRHSATDKRYRPKRGGTDSALEDRTKTDWDRRSEVLAGTDNDVFHRLDSRGSAIGPDQWIAGRAWRSDPQQRSRLQPRTTSLILRISTDQFPCPHPPKSPCTEYAQFTNPARRSCCLDYSANFPDAMIVSDNEFVKNCARSRRAGCRREVCYQISNAVRVAGQGPPVC